jgi:hypothetical protein
MAANCTGYPQRTNSVNRVAVRGGRVFMAARLRICVASDDEFVEVWMSGVADGCDFAARREAVVQVDVVDRLRLHACRQWD